MILIFIIFYLVVKRKIISIIKLEMHALTKLDKFKIIDALKDGSCLYKCLLNYILLNIVKLYNNERNNINNELNNLLKHFNCVLKDQLNEQLVLKDLINFSDIDDELNTELVDEITIYLQKLLKNVAVCNNILIPNIDIDFHTLILTTHGDYINTVAEYDKLFDIYSGDNDYITIDSEDVYKSGKNEGDFKKIKKNIPPRWGGLSEIYAFAMIFKLNVIIYVLKRKTKKTDKIVNSTEKFKDSYYSKHFEYFNETNTNTVELLLSENKSPHYRLLIPNY